MSEPLATILILVVAVAVDVLLGEPPNVLHPVVWMGKMVQIFQRVAPAHGAVRQLLWGAVTALLVPAFFAVTFDTLSRSVAQYPWLDFPLRVFILKSTFSLWGLKRAAWELKAALARSLDDARFSLRSLCSRDPTRLSAEELIAATVESVAENASDSFVAPLFYFALFGLPGAVLYRAVNTMDAMLGYRGEYEYLGKVPARLDDLLNLVPARLCTLLMWLAGVLSGEDARRGLRIALRDHNQTESPNAGWPMAMMAGLLGARLTKPNCYTLGDALAKVEATMIDRAFRVVAVMGALATLTTALSLVLRSVYF